MKNKQKGATSILLALLLLSVILVIALGGSALMLGQIQMSGQAGQSVVAFYAADAGAERCLYTIRKTTASTSCPYTDVSLDFNSQATYTTVYEGGTDLTSIGQFGVTSRKLELSW